MNDNTKPSSGRPKPVVELESKLGFYLQYFTDQNFLTLIPDSLTGVRGIEAMRLRIKAHANKTTYKIMLVQCTHFHYYCKNFVQCNFRHELGGGAFAFLLLFPYLIPQQ